MKTAVKSVQAAGDWANANHDKVAQSLSEITKIPFDVQQAAAARTDFAVTRSPTRSSPPSRLSPTASPSSA